MTRPLSRAVGAAALTSLLALALTACGSDDASEDGSGGGSEGAATTVSTKFGDVEVPPPGEVTKVVALGWGDAETALALGVQPVGASDWLGFGEENEGVGPWAEGMYDEAPVFFGTMELDTEAIGELAPDLILDTKSSGDQARYDALSKIAPVVGIPEGADNYLTTTEQQVEMIAQALGKESEGEALLDGVDEAFEAAADANPGFAGRSVTVSAYGTDGWGVYTDGDARVQFLEELGFEQASQIDEIESDSFFVPVSDEELDLLDADVMVSFPIFVEGSEITDQPLYQSLPAVAEDRAVVIDDLTLGNAYSLGTTMALEYAIENVVPLLDQATATP